MEKGTELVKQEVKPIRIGNLAVKLSRFNVEEVAVIKNSVAKGATDVELAYFLQVCETYNLDPLLKEIWCIKYATKDDGGQYDFEHSAATICVSRDGYLKAARANPKFKNFMSAVVYTTDKFNRKIQIKRDAQGNAQVVSEMNHEVGQGPQGEILGAWAWGERTDGQTFDWYCDFNKYKKKTRIWTQNPDAMIAARAETIVLRKLFGISGVYSEVEIDPSELIDVRENYPEELFDGHMAKILAAKNVDELDLVGNELKMFILPSKIREAFSHAYRQKKFEFGSSNGGQPGNDEQIETKQEEPEPEQHKKRGRKPKDKVVDPEPATESVVVDAGGVPETLETETQTEENEPEPELEKSTVLNFGPSGELQRVLTLVEKLKEKKQKFDWAAQILATHKVASFTALSREQLIDAATILEQLLERLK